MILLLLLALPVPDGRAVFAEYCSIPYCHGAEGGEGRAPALRGRAWDEGSLRKTIADGIPDTSMPPFGERLAPEEMNALVDFILSFSSDTSTSVSPAAGPPSPGRPVFFEKGCAACHRFGRGDAAGPDLAGAAAKRPFEILRDLLEPEAAIAWSKPFVRVETAGRESFSAVEEEANDTFIRVHDLSSMPPVLRRLPRRDVARMEPLPGSPMPPGGSLFARESLDLVFFIRSGGASEDRIEVVSRPVSFWSEGTRLSGALFHPKGLGSGEKLPAIVMSGGLAQVLDDAYAPYFAAEGFAVLTFDYRGRGRSDGRLSSEVGEAINPRDPTEDIVRAIDFLEREEIVDPARLGYWGAGDSGGHALRIAGHDARIKAVVAQAPAMDSRADPRLVKAPILILDAGEGEVREIRENGAKLYEIVKDRVPSRYHVFPGTTRDDLHGRKRAEAVGMAIEWFREHLGISPRPGDSKLR